MSQSVIIENGSGYSEVLGVIGGLTVSETCNGYVGLFKNCEKHYILEENNLPELFTIEIDHSSKVLYLDNVKINFVDQQGWVYFISFKPIKKL